MKGDFSDVRQVSSNFDEPRLSITKVGRRRSSTKTPLDSERRSRSSFAEKPN